MAQIIVRNLDNDVKELLAINAKLNGHSMEEEVRQILKNSVKTENKKHGFGTQISNRFKEVGLDFEIEEQKGFTTRNPFEEE
jgi:plasmid stability protein